MRISDGSSDVCSSDLLIVASLLALAALLVVGNTVRVDIASRSEEIGVLLLVGAGKAFVRRPYLHAGIWYGLFSGLLAAALAGIGGASCRDHVGHAVSV